MWIKFIVFQVKYWHFGQDMQSIFNIIKIIKYYELNIYNTDGYFLSMDFYESIFFPIRAVTELRAIRSKPH